MTLGWAASGAAISVPPSVTVAAGSTQATFNAQGTSGALTTPVNIVATLNGANQSFSLTVSPSAKSTGTATFLKTDTVSQGTWKGVYGADGYNVIGDTTAYPSYVTVTPSGNLSWTWTAFTNDVRALQKAASTTGRIAGCWYTSGAMSVDLNFTDSASHQVALYTADWDNYTGGRTEQVDVLDANGTVLDTRTVANFVSGEYLVWNLSGHVAIRVTNTKPSANAVLLGLFFGGASSSAPAGPGTFLRADTTTSGSWKGVYGADGYNVIGNVFGTSTAYPSYAIVTPSGYSFWTWAASTGDVRALQKAASTGDRIAGCWYTPSSMTIDINLTDGNTHQVALYFLDWDGMSGGRAETVDILDATGHVIDTRTVSNFYNGVYLVWNLSGHVTARITNTNGGANAVLSGLFFR